MPAYRPIDVVLAARRVSRPAPITYDRLGQPIIGPCLVWTGKSRPDGYGQVKNKDLLTGAPQLVHRVAWAVAHGIPFDKLTEVPLLDHLCRVRACSAAAHLHESTIIENLALGDINQNFGKTECIRGHKFDEANTIKRKDGTRGCKACKRDGYRRKHAPDLVGLPALSPAERGGRKGSRRRVEG